MQVILLALRQYLYTWVSYHCIELEILSKWTVRVLSWTIIRLKNEDLLV